MLFNMLRYSISLGLHQLQYAAGQPQLDNPRSQAVARWLFNEAAGALGLPCMDPEQGH